jgi:hypothetical protein
MRGLKTMNIKKILLILVITASNSLFSAMTYEDCQAANAKAAKSGSMAVMNCTNLQHAGINKGPGLVIPNGGINIGAPTAVVAHKPGTKPIVVPFNSKPVIGLPAPKYLSSPYYPACRQDCQHLEIKNGSFTSLNMDCINACIDLHEAGNWLDTEAVKAKLWAESRW